MIDLEVPVRSGTTADWAAAGAPVLDVGELGLNVTTGELRGPGNASTPFADLPSITPRTVSVTLVGGTKVTADTKIKATSKIIPVVVTLGTVTIPKVMRVSKSAGASFTITSEDATDTSTLEVYVWN